MIVKGSVPVFPTEDPERVRICILNIFPDAKIEESDVGFEFSSEDLEHFSDLIFRQQIRDTALMILERSMKGNRTSFSLNKQTCFVEKVNFASEGTLGVVKVEIEEGGEELIDQLKST